MCDINFEDIETSNGSKAGIFEGSIYKLVDYTRNGLLVDVYSKCGDKGLAKDLKLLGPFMYCGGKGMPIKESLLLGKKRDPQKDIKRCFRQPKGADGDPSRAENECKLNVEWDVDNDSNTRKMCWKLPFRGLYGESLLHILIICNTKSHTQIAKQLIHRYPALIFDIFESEEYFGASALHLSIAYRNEELTELLLKLGAPVNQRANGTFFLPTDQQQGKLFHRQTNFAGLCYLGEYPHVWAACMDDKRTYNALISHGADPNLQDTFGNMTLHVVVEKERLMFYNFVYKHPIRPADDDVSNRYGQTPLALACVLGKDRIFREIIELKCFDFWTYSRVVCCGYPLDVLDSMQLTTTSSGPSVEIATKSALNLIVKGKTDRHIEMLKGGIVEKLLEEKWKTFGYVFIPFIALSFVSSCNMYYVRFTDTLLFHVYSPSSALLDPKLKFTRSLMVTFVYLMVLSLAVFLRPTQGVHLCQESTLLSVLRPTAEVLTLIACIKSLSNHVMELITKGLTNLIANMKRSLSTLVFTISNILILCSTIFRFWGMSSAEDTLVVLALPMAWFFLIFFASAMRLTGPFISMIRYMIIQDMRQFSIIYLVFVYGFSQAFYFLLKHPLREVKAPNHGRYSDSWMELFRMTLGAHNYEDLRSSYYHWMTQMFFVLFLILVPILLLNMLIAMMGNTYGMVISQSEREWTMQWAKILLEIERGLGRKEASVFVDQYTINMSPKDAPKPSTALMVIKRMSKSKAKQRLEAISNWRKLRWKLKTFITTQITP